MQARRVGMAFEQDQAARAKVSVFTQYWGQSFYTGESFGCSRAGQLNRTTIFDPLNLSVKWGWLFTEAQRILGYDRRNIDDWRLSSFA
ncbi:hypothetical protein [Rhizobium sp. PDO1-076]|uniref:hypothetical protein n=1 Tax=Rhizobium sp. PDO1-076 TaxID=1125979 RepID=UPI00114748DF|nr:hypothetical protein [Rhizobium sp. PDO1-076]